MSCPSLRIASLLTLCLIGAIAAEPVTPRALPLTDLVAPVERPDSAGGTLRLRVVERRGSLHPVRLSEHRDALGTTTTRAMVADHLLVALRPGTDAAACAAANGCTLRRRIPATDLWLFAFTTPDPEAPDRMRTRLAATPAVLRVEPDWCAQLAVTPDDPDFATQWNLRNTGQSAGTAGADIKAVEAWDISTGSRDVVVAVIDTGIAHGHAQLAANLWTNPAESGLDAQGRDRRNNGIDDDGNGYVDDWRGWDFVNDDNDADDDHGHGTHCAGIVGAAGNDGRGVTGVCWRVSLVGLKFLDAGGYGAYSDAIAAVRYAAGLRLPILSNSWGGSSRSDELEAAFAFAAAQGSLICAAAGNGYGSNNDRIPYYPANLALPTLLSVAATNRWDEPAWFSNVGPHTVHLAAPGEEILSTVPDGQAVMSGTSMATPHVAGVAALLKTARPDLDATALRQLLLDGARRLDVLTPVCASGARLDAAASLRLATGAWLTDAGVATATQDGDACTEPGERIDLRWTLANAGVTAGGPVLVTLATAGGDPALTITTGAVTIASIAAGTQAIAPPLSFTTASTLATPHTARLVLSANWPGGPTIRRAVEVVLRRTHTLTCTLRRQTGGAVLANTSAFLSLQPTTDGLIAPTNAQGAIAVDLPEGTYQISGSALGLRIIPRTITLPPTQNLDLYLGAPDIRVATPAAVTVAQGQRTTVTLGIENRGDLPLRCSGITVAGQFAATGLWHRSTRRLWAGGPVWWYGRDDTGDYDTGTRNDGTLTLPTVSVPAQGGTLAFWSHRDAESSWWDEADLSTIDISDDAGTTWRTVAMVTDQDDGDGWTPHTIPLTDWAGRTITARFRFDTMDDVSNDQEGWYVAGITACGQVLESRGWGTPTACTVAPGIIATCAVTIDTTGLAAGNRTVAVTISSDDPDTPDLVVQVPLIVTAAPAPELVSMTVVDHAPDGDGDGWAEVAEIVSWVPRIANGGAAATFTATLTMDRPTDVEVLTGSVSGTITAATTANLPPFRIRPLWSPFTDMIVTGGLIVSGGGVTRSIPVTLTMTRRAAIAGRVVDATSGAPLAGVTVNLLQYGAPVTVPRTTTADGRFRFPDLYTYAPFTVAVDVVGMSPVREQVTVSTDQDLTLRIGRRLLTVTPATLAGTVDAGGQTTMPLTLVATGNLDVTCTIRSAAANGSYVVETSDDVAGPAWDWVEATSDDGSSAQLPLGHDATRTTFTGFAFPFYDTTVSEVAICAHGWMSFTDRHADSYSRSLPTAYAPRDLIATWWDYSRLDANSRFYEQRLDGRFIVQADGVIPPSGATRLSYQTELTADGTITMRYRSISRQTWMLAGLQNRAATEGLTAQFVDGLSPFIRPGWRIHDQSVIRFRRSVRFTHLPNGGASMTAVVPAGGSITIPVLCGAYSWPAGSYRDRLLVTADALDQPWSSIPVTLTITGSGGGDGDHDPETVGEGGGGGGCGLGSGLTAILGSLMLMLAVRLRSRQRP